jgi:hypothetical protein
LIGVAGSKKRKQQRKGTSTRCTSARWKSAQVRSPTRACRTNTRTGESARCSVTATSDACREATTRVANCCETPPPLRQIRLAPPRFPQHSTGLHVVPPLSIKSNSGDANKHEVRVSVHNARLQPGRCNCLPRRSADECRSRPSPACAGRRICNAEPRLLFYFFLGDFITPSAMHSHLPLRSIQVSTQT